MAPKTCANCHAFSTTRELKTCGRCMVVDYCNRECQKAHYQAHKLDCRKTKAAGDKLAKEPTRDTQHHLKDSTTRLQIAKQQAQIATSTPNVALKLQEQSSRQTVMSISGNAGSGMVTVCHPNGTEIPITADRVMMKQMPPTPENPQGYTRFHLFTAEELAGTENMGVEERKAYRQKLAEEKCAKRDGRKTLQTTEAEQTTKKETNGLFEDFPEPDLTLQNGTAKSQSIVENVQSDDRFTRTLLPLAFVRLDNHGGAILRGAGGRDVVRPAGSFVTKRMPPTLEMQQGYYDVLILPAEWLEQTKTKDPGKRTRLNQAFAEDHWAKTAATKEQLETGTRKQQVMAVEYICNDVEAMKAAA